ncbi:MAG: single-stranded-DNA-specific exonuclease RecJ [Chloroflexi bacterium HGW-Chloroflexi-3]|nr:MAG: single-stranded-DNA-specific exonuclease RecJ [Chloroflexi bacterium HGW-Chloroflexi-3]
MATYKWVEKKKSPVPKEIQERFPNPWVQQIFARNNIFNIEAAQRFINPSLYIPTPSSELPDLDVATHRLLEAIANRELIGIWGDFDVDGQTATTVLFEGLKNLGANVIYYIPVRSKESHGIKLSSLKEFLKNGISILLTCDTGISEHESIEYANQQGVDVLVTDHHSLPEILPKAMAKVNPQRLPEAHPLRTLSGVGVAYKLIEWLYQLSGKNDDCVALLDLVALGTVADVAILTGENRYLVQMGLRLLQNPTRIGLQEIYKNRKLQNGQITETHIGFYLAPLLNALGRLSDANQIVDFLTTNDLQKAKVFAAQLENINERRKLITEQITDAILSKFELNKELQNQPAIIMHHSEWEAGVLGIVANRLVEIYQKPTILLTGKKDTDYFGSARSIENLNIIKAIQTNADYLNHFGGHAMAAGLSLEPDKLSPFQDSFNKTVLNLVGETIFQKELQIDGYINFDLITMDFVRELEKLAPFGPGNPAPLFASKDVVIEKIRKMGRKSEHLKITASDTLENIQEFIWWRANQEDLPDEKMDIAFYLHSSNYQGKPSVQVEILAIQPSETTLAEVNIKNEALEVIDYRKKSPGNQEWLEKYDDILWYQEGLKQDFSRTHNRLNLHPAETLIIFTIPPNLSELQKIYLTVRPTHLVLFGNQPLEKSVNLLIKTIAGMLNHVIKNRNGLFRPFEIAVAIGQRKTTVETVCRYLHAIGQITLLEHPDTQWLVKHGGKKDAIKAELYQQNIDFLHRETLAFYKWFKEVDLDKLQNSMFDF